MKLKLSFVCFVIFTVHIVCDGKEDCENGKDNESCNGTTTIPPRTINSTLFNNGSLCPKWMFMCRNLKCIPERWKCDNSDDCGDNSDEIGCPHNSSVIPIQSIPAFSCKSNEFKCLSNSCIPMTLVCDGKLDCNDGNDEQNCNEAMTSSPGSVNSTLPNNGTVCTEGTFMCKNKICIPERWKCDEENDCGDHSDEIGCVHNSTLAPSQSTSSIPLPFSCQINEFKCLSNFCIPRSWVCDLKDDCEGGEDELYCANNVCLHNEFSCGSPNYNCINSLLVCDGQPDCNDGKDEQNCTGTIIKPPVRGRLGA